MSPNGAGYVAPWQGHALTTQTWELSPQGAMGFIQTAGYPLPLSSTCMPSTGSHESPLLEMSCTVPETCLVATIPVSRTCAIAQIRPREQGSHAELFQGTCMYREASLCSLPLLTPLGRGAF